eukprot:8847706-Pyramimonas_sp.AAC.1
MARTRASPRRCAWPRPSRSRSERCVSGRGLRLLRHRWRTSLQTESSGPTATSRRGRRAPRTTRTKNKDVK